MKFARFSFTLVTAVFFLFALQYEGVLFGEHTVSRITTVKGPDVYVGEGVGMGIVISVIDTPPHAPTRTKIANHQRTLRAYVAKWLGENNTLFIERVKPHTYYVVEGNFFISRPEESLIWSDDQTIVVRAVLPDGRRGSLYVNTISGEANFTQEFIRGSQSIPESTVVSGEETVL